MRRAARYLAAGEDITQYGEDRRVRPTTARVCCSGAAGRNPRERIQGTTIPNEPMVPPSPPCDVQATATPGPATSMIARLIAMPLRRRAQWRDARTVPE